MIRTQHIERLSAELRGDAGPCRHLLSAALLQEMHDRDAANYLQTEKVSLSVEKWS